MNFEGFGGSWSRFVIAFNVGNKKNPLADRARASALDWSQVAG